MSAPVCVRVCACVCEHVCVRACMYMLVRDELSLNCDQEFEGPLHYKTPKAASCNETLL
jgi:hypothetical protein